MPGIANFWRVGVLDVVLSEYLNKSHNFTNFIFMTSSLRYSIVLPLENKIHIFAPPCNILYIFFVHWVKNIQSTKQYSGFQVIGMIEGFFGWFEIFDFGIFWEEKVWQVVFESGSF